MLTRRIKKIWRDLMIQRKNISLLFIFVIKFKLLLKNLLNFSLNINLNLLKINSRNFKEFSANMMMFKLILKQCIFEILSWWQRKLMLLFEDRFVSISKGLTVLHFSRLTWRLIKWFAQSAKWTLTLWKLIRFSLLYLKLSIIWQKWLTEWIFILKIKSFCTLKMTSKSQRLIKIYLQPTRKFSYERSLFIHFTRRRSMKRSPKLSLLLLFQMKIL